MVFILGLSIIMSVHVQARDQQRMKVAVLDLDAEEGISQGALHTLSDYLRVQLFKNGQFDVQRFDIIPREDMEQILKNQKFQLSVHPNLESIIQVGKLLKVHKIFTGSIGKVGSTYIITLKMIDVDSGRIEKIETEECFGPKEEALIESIKIISSKIIGQIITQKDEKYFEQEVSDSSTKLVAELSGYLRNQLGKTDKFTVISKEKMEQILEENDFQPSLDIGDIIHISQLFEVDKIFTGYIEKAEFGYNVSLQIFDTKSNRNTSITKMQKILTKGILITSLDDFIARTVAEQEEKVTVAVLDFEVKK